jgi:hypothetical protein
VLDILHDEDIGQTDALVGGPCLIILATKFQRNISVNWVIAEKEAMIGGVAAVAAETNGLQHYV